MSDLHWENRLNKAQLDYLQLISPQVLQNRNRILHFHNQYQHQIPKKRCTNHSSKFLFLSITPVISTILEIFRVRMLANTKAVSNHIIHKLPLICTVSDKLDKTQEDQAVSQLSKAWEIINRKALEILYSQFHPYMEGNSSHLGL